VCESFSNVVGAFLFFGICRAFFSGLMLLVRLQVRHFWWENIATAVSKLVILETRFILNNS